MLRQGQRGQVRIPRQLGASLLANMFLCTFDKIFEENMPEAMPVPSCCWLLTCTDSPHEVAKLQMFIHFFERIDHHVLPGEVVIDRIQGVALTASEWQQSDKALLTMEVAERKIGFETAPELAHADFANKFLGGGVFSGGCVQEEIRFAICPELCLSMLICSCMQADEAVQITGSEQFSAYKGYGWSLEYAGDHVDQAVRRADGSVKTAVLAMDALDFRGDDSSLRRQLHPALLERELNKSLAAFTPVDQQSLEDFPIIATGNWGCGAFGGCVQLKALIQWASASQCGRRLRYFPFEQGFGAELQDLAAASAQAGLTVGQLLGFLWNSTEGPMTEDEIFRTVRNRLIRN